MDIDNFDIPLPDTPESPEIKPLEGGSEFEANFKNWASIWPIYLDSTKSVKQGRRVSKSKAHDHPHFFVIAHIAQSLGLDTVVEQGKRHPKDSFLYGKVRVKLNPNIPNAKSKNALIKYISEHYSETKVMFEENKIQLNSEAKKMFDSLKYDAVSSPHMLEQIFTPVNKKPSKEQVQMIDSNLPKTSNRTESNKRKNKKKE